MPSFIGTGADQVPVNSMLGSLAYQNADDVKLGKITYSGTLVGTGNVGVGGTPVDNGACITIRNPGTGSANLYLQNSTSGSSITDGVVLNYDGSNVYLWAYENIPFVVATNNTQRFRVDQSGWAAFYSGGSTVVIGSGLIADGTTNDSILRWDSAGALKICKVTSTIAQFTNAGDFELKTTGYLKLPEGTTAQRPASPQEGMIRKNSDTGKVESFTRGSWKPLAEEQSYQSVNIFDNAAFCVAIRPAISTYAGTSFADFPTDRWQMFASGSHSSTSVSATTNSAYGSNVFNGKALLVTNNTSVTIPTSGAIAVGQYTTRSPQLYTPSVMTLSFKVGSSVTGTYSVCIRSQGFRYVTSYQILSANTLEKKIITIPLNPSATKQAGNFRVDFILAAGSSFAATPDVWQSNGAMGAVAGSTNITATSGHVIAFAEMQLEFGDSSTPFILKEPTVDRVECSRHYQSSMDDLQLPTTAGMSGAVLASPSATTNYASFGTIQFNPPMDLGNTITLYSPATGAAGMARNNTTSTDVPAQILSIGKKGFSARVNNTSTSANNDVWVHWVAVSGY